MNRTVTITDRTNKFEKDRHVASLPLLKEAHAAHYSYLSYIVAHAPAKIDCRFLNGGKAANR